jgi:hypothetical protein
VRRDHRTGVAGIGFPGIDFPGSSVGRPLGTASAATATTTATAARFAFAFGLTGSGVFDGFRLFAIALGVALFARLLRDDIVASPFTGFVTATTATATAATAALAAGIAVVV